MRKRRKNDAEAAHFIAGLVLRPEAASQEENRIFTLFFKGVLVYLIVMGTMGCFLSALKIEYSRWTVHVIVFLIAVLCSMLYYNKYVMNIGYLAVLAVMVFAGGGFSRYINSGFYSVMNEVAQAASDFFHTSAMRSYGEQIGNRYLAVTVSMCYIGCVCSVLLSITISRKLRHLLAFLISAGLMLIPLYFDLEPEGIYMAMLFGGFFAADLLCRSGYGRLTPHNARYEYAPVKKKISCVQDFRAMAGLFIAVFLFCLLLVGFFSAIYPKAYFQKTHPMSAMKKRTMDTVENISLLGLMGLFNFYPNTGGMMNGTLGDVNSVRLDFETDLTVELTPYSEERIYLKNFTGGVYLPYENKWGRLTDEYGKAVPEQDETFRLLLERYERGEEYAARGMMKITNAAAPAGPYLPYYAQNTEKSIYPGQTQEYIYYPRVSPDIFSGAEADSVKEAGSMEQWLYVPEQNLDVVASFCREAGLAEGRDVFETAAGLAAYYQEEIPYTLRPGRTPYRKDFINYFLAENRRGYCAHFASAATLIFRYLGIPARYVEGYVIDPADLSDHGERLDVRYEDYYDGYLPIGTTAVVSVDVSDANAHAWVEVYDSQHGWLTVEVTPASEEEENEESLWQRLLRFLTGDQENNAAEDEAETAEEEETDGEKAGRVTGWFIRAAVIVIAMVLVGRQAVIRWRKAAQYRRADRNEKLILLYRDYIAGITRKQNGLTGRVNYEEQICWLVREGFWTADEEERRSCTAILEKAGFSQTEVSIQEFQRVAGHLKNRKRADAD